MIAIEEIINSKRNNTLEKDLPIHNWYNFVLGFPPHLVQYYINKFGITKGDLVLDPFSGTGTTTLECLKNGIDSLGIEANFMAYQSSKVKTYNNYSVEALTNFFEYICLSIKENFTKYEIYDNDSCINMLFSEKTKMILTNLPELKEESFKIIPKDFISEKPLLKVLIINKIIESIEIEEIKDFFKIALAKLIVKKAGNIAFGPEIYKSNVKDDISAIKDFYDIGRNMISEVQKYKAEAKIFLADSRKLDILLKENLDRDKKINYIITSPPYPNEKDYTRSTRLESVLLGYINNKSELRELKKTLLRSNTRNIYIGDTDDEFIRKFPDIVNLANTIEARRIELNKTSGFEKLYHKVVLQYFGGMYLHLKKIKPFLSHDAKLAYVLGDQMSYFQIPIYTAKLLGQIAEYLGYEVVEIELWRTRIATSTKMQVEENVLILNNKKGVKMAKIIKIPKIVKMPKIDKILATSDYDTVIEKMFFSLYLGNESSNQLEFSKDDLVKMASDNAIIIKNIPDIIYTYRSRRELPETINKTGFWIIQPMGKGKLAFTKIKRSPFVLLTSGLASIDILNATPEIVEKYTKNDEQGMLSHIRYNRLIDIFTGITCFHLQSHVRTTILGEGQIEIDELYVGIDKDGIEYIIPLEAKSHDERDKLGWIQMTNMVKYAKQNFPHLKCKAIAAKPIENNHIQLIEFDDKTDLETIGITNMKVYKLVRESSKTN